MICIEEIKKIYKLIWGNEKTFGYKTEQANQLYFIYCLTGRIFTTDKLYWITKALWLSWSYGAVVMLYASILSFLYYGELNDFTTCLYIAFLFGITSFVAFAMPLVTYWFSEDIEKMIQHVDDIPFEKPIIAENLEHVIDINKNFKNFAKIIAVEHFFYTMICVLDVALFYEPEKITNYMYYLIPLPRLEHYATPTFFYVYNIAVTLLTSLPMFQCVSIGIFFWVWSSCCFNEILKIADTLQSTSAFIFPNDCKKYTQIAENTRMKQFHMLLANSVRRLNEVDRRVRWTLPFFELIISTVLTTSFVMQVCHLYILFTATELPKAPLIKELTVFLYTSTLIFVMCYAGEILDEMANTLSFGVYSMPWYAAPIKARKEILILLGAAQKTTHARIAKIYAINGITFMRFVNSIYSTTQIISEVTNK